MISSLFRYHFYLQRKTTIIGIFRGPRNPQPLLIKDPTLPASHANRYLKLLTQSATAVTSLHMNQTCAPYRKITDLDLVLAPMEPWHSSRHTQTVTGDAPARSTQTYWTPSDSTSKFPFNDLFRYPCYVILSSPYLEKTLSNPQQLALQGAPQVSLYGL